MPLRPETLSLVFVMVRGLILATLNPQTGPGFDEAIKETQEHVLKAADSPRERDGAHGLAGLRRFRDGTAVV